MAVLVLRNEELNGIEVKFDGIPESATREALKKNGFRWHKVKKLWYAKQTEKTIIFANSLAGVQTIPETNSNNYPEKPSTELIEEFKNNLVDVWGSSQKMVEHCMKSMSNIWKLSNGDMIIFDKPSIETRFCFDDSRDYEGALKMADYASKSEKYFLDENLQDFNQKIDALEQLIAFEQGEERQNNYSSYYHNKNIYSYRGKYYRQSEKNTLSALSYMYLAEYENEKTRKDYHQLTLDELKMLLEVYKTEKRKFEKRLNSYLKRYGMSKVQTWTYWGDR